MAAAEEWLRQALEATTGREWVHELTPETAARAFQRFLVTAGELAGADLTFDARQRERVRAAFERGFGARLPGPPWRAAPHETDLPTYEEWGDQATFS